MTHLSKARLLALCEGIKANDKRIVIADTPEGVIIGVDDGRGFVPLAAVWPDSLETSKAPTREPMGFKPDKPLNWPAQNWDGKKKDEVN